MPAKASLDRARYSKLIARIAPTVPKTEKEYDRLMSEFEPLFDRLVRGELTAEEDALFELLATLLHQYEKDHLAVGIKADPVGMLRFFMEQQDKRPSDLWHVLGSKSLVSEILNGNRKININHAKKLAAFFNTSAANFLDLE
jgi:HTH-type transcriptional regulator / antitoxin HigA